MAKIQSGNILRDETASEGAERQARELAWSNGAGVRAALSEISRLETLITNRRLREAALTAAGKTWLQGIEDLIAVERAKL